MKMRMSANEDGHRDHEEEVDVTTKTAATAIWHGCKIASRIIWLFLPKTLFVVTVISLNGKSG
jgi:hypothetical protein